MFLKDHYKKMDSLLVWEVIQHWTKQIDNWVFSDELSAKYSFLLEQEEDLVYEKLKYWNQSDFSWERRQSVVSLLYYHRQRRTFLSYDKYIQLVHPLLEDKDYFVQKGVGWALREIYQQYPEETLIYIFEHALKIAAPAYTAVTEKLPEELRVQFRALRSEFRQKNRKQTD
jgi:3-methyladenine DNA glycosylase AlkD